MPAFRDLKRQARRDLHSRMQIAANYYAEPNGPFRTISIRLTTKEKIVNEASGRVGLAGIEDAEPKILFMLDECDPVDNAVVSLEIDEAYRVVVVELPDDISVTAKCIRLRADEASQYTPPSVQVNVGCDNG